MIRIAASLPSTILDLTPAGERTLLARRKFGGNPVNWFGQSPRALKAQPANEHTPFVIVMFPETESVRDYESWLGLCRIRPVLVANTGGDLSFTTLTIRNLQAHFSSVCDSLPGTVDASELAAAKNAIAAWQEPTTKKLGYQVGGHNSITPNLMVLESAGFADLLFGPFPVSLEQKPYVDQITRTANSVLSVREAAGEPLGHDLLGKTFDVNLFAPAVYPHIFSLNLPTAMDRTERERFVVARRLLQKQRGYSHTSQSAAQHEVFLGNLTDARTSGSVSPHPLFLIRQEELRLATVAMGALAVSEVAPVLRLPNEVNRASGLIRNFAQSYRSASPVTRKRLRGFKAVQDFIRSAVPAEFYSFITNATTGIRIVSDAPLEWLDIDGLPLSIRKNVARIPVTPGNLFISVLSAHEPLILTPEDLSEVLILRAIDTSENIRKALDIAIRAFEPHLRDRIRLKQVEVSSAQEMVDGLNGFEGNIVIFDGHGGHEEDAAATLLLKGTPVDVWELHGQIKRMPPIILLSACDTHAADRNHATTGNGFLALGARAVLASLFPLSALDAATFIARLLFRIAEFVPAAFVTYRRAITWTEVVSGMLRMQLLTDFLRLLLAENVIDEARYIEVHQHGNIGINAGGTSPDPFNDVKNMLVQGGTTAAFVNSAFELALANSGAISYVHLGRPETIIINDARVLAQYRQNVSEIRENLAGYPTHRGFR